MDKTESGEELSPEGRTKIQAVDGYLGETIQRGRPLEALTAIRMLGEIASKRSKEAARAATDGASSWTDVGRALGMSKQAAHEKLRARVRGEIDKGLAQIQRAEEAGHAKIARRASRGREQLDRTPPFTPKVDIARQRIDEWEEGQHDKLDRKLKKARESVAGAERSVKEKFDTD